MNTLRIASVTALVLATLLHAQALAQSQGRLDRPPGTSSARHDTPAEQRAGGEFARLVTVPAACQAAREFGQSGRWKSQLSFQEPIQVGRPPTETPGPACLAAESCFQALKSQAAAGVEYLTRNPAVAEALSSQRQGTDPRSRSTAPVHSRLQQLLASYSGSSWGPFKRCTLLWNTIDSQWFQLTDRSFVRGPTFENFVTAGQTLLQQIRSDYAADESEYQQLLAFNDKYPGIERLERARGSYQLASKNDDMAAMIRDRQAMLQELEQAKARKHLLTQQSAQMAQYEQTLADSVIAIEREGLTSFADQQTQTAMSALRSELARLTQTAPGKRGDISAQVQIFASKIRNIDSSIGSARSMKAQAEQTRRMLVENEGEARRYLERAASEELKGTFGEEFWNSTGELISQFTDLGSSDLAVIRQRQGDVDAARRKLGILQNRISEAEARYNRAKELDSTRQAMMQKMAGALSELERPEIRGKLGDDGLAVIASLRRYQDTLSTFDSVRLINRIDYSDTLAAADDALAKAQQFKNEAEARYNRAKQLDGTRQAMMKKMAGALSELEQPEIGGKLGNDGVAVIEGLKSYQGTLKGFDGVRLIDQVDYSDALAAADDALAKAQQFKNEIAQVDQVVNDLQELNKRIDRRGRRLLDGPTSSTVADIGKSVSRLSAAKIPLSSEARLQLSDTRVTLNRLPKIVDNVMDGEEKSILGREMPTRRGAWRFSLDKDKITDEERVQAFASIGSSQAKYDLAVTCGRFGAELVITTFESVGTEPKRLPWRFYGPTLDKDIRLRIDSNAAFGARLEMRGYINQGQVKPTDRAQFEKLLHSSRLVFSDVFPDEQVEVATAFPIQFSRLCELLASR